MYRSSRWSFPGSRSFSRYRTFLLLLLCVALVLTAGRPVIASTSIDVNDPIYELLSRLEADGVIADALLSTKPLSRREVVRLTLAAEKNAVGRSGFIKAVVRDLKRRVQADEYAAGAVKPVESVYAAYITTNADVLSLVYPGPSQQKEQAFNQNNDGDLYGRGSNYRIGLTSRLEDLGPLSFYLNPEFRSDGDASEGVLKKGYGVLGFSWIDIVAGRDSQWWGPGYHGSLLLSNNAEPLTLIKLTGPEAQVLPWVFKYLGPFQYSIFFTRLEKDRTDVPEPYFWGTRIDFKPHPAIEIGLERTALLGGQGIPTDASTWLHSMFGSREHSDAGNAGDQRAGGDLKITLPLEWQPVQLYTERDGEDNRQRHVRWPYKFANLYGIYLPRIAGHERIEMRAEYALTHVNEAPAVWYTHGVYTDGYTNRRMIMGHHMGTDSRDLFLQVSYRLPEQGARISFSFDSAQHNVEGPVSEEATELTLNGVILLSQHVEFSALLGYGRIDNPGNTAGPTRSVSQFSSVLRYVF